MNAKHLLKRLYFSPILGEYFITPLYDFVKRCLPDQIYARLKFKYRFGYKLNISNPVTLNEKIQWLKLYDRTSLHTMCADKYAVREYVKNIIGEKYLVPLVFHTSKIEELIPQNLPDYPIILKTNHSSSRYYIIRNKHEVDWDKIRMDFKKWLNENIYYTRKEWQYKNIKPRVVVEKLLMDSEGSIPNDYKFHCFNGEVKIISIDVGRGSNNHIRNWYFPNWERAPFKWSSVFNGNRTDPSVIEFPPPLGLNKMISLSSQLANNFKYVRIDWYNVGAQVFFGEITFHHDGGFQPILPYEWDVKLGSYIDL